MTPSKLHDAARGCDPCNVNAPRNPIMVNVNTGVVLCIHASVMPL